VAALGSAQTAPQPPQSAVLVSDVSQPLVASPSQSASPGAQLEGTQEPAAHVLPSAHIAPHFPQLAAVFVLASHPSLGEPSQSAKSTEQLAMAHVPVAHVPLPFAITHVVPHAPQFATSVSVLSQPFSGFPSQS
jgi:hypothetical protein